MAEFQGPATPDMRLRNDQGKPVDPVPFVVTVTAAFLALYSFGPGYLLGLGLTLPESLAVVTAAFGSTTAVSYHWHVRRARPERRGEVPGTVRLKRLYYAVLIGMAVVVLLMLPFHV